jgi:seryl-tRNA synthetase
MLEIDFILDNPDVVRANNEKRGVDIDIEKTRELANERSEMIQRVQSLREQANDISGKIPQAGDDERKELIEQARDIKEQVQEEEAKLESVEKQLNELLIQFPNILRDDVPEGEDESDNEVMREVGEKTTFDFKPKDHLELAEELGLIDMERAAKVSGARFAYLTGELVTLQFALMQYAFSVVLPEGFTPVIPPHMVSTDAMGAMGYLQHGGEEEIYHLKNDDLVMIGTSEQSLGPRFMNEIIERELPVRMVGYSPCYRREAGSYGKDTRGIFRVHQFDKVEMFTIVHPDHSDDEHDFLLSIQERLMKGLNLPYRVVRLCAGDTGTPAARTYDIETWIPSQKRYRETHSTSNTTDFQMRRLKTRFKEDGENKFPHALNGTAFALGRTMIAILENNQRADGTVVVPEVLRPWTNFDVIGE